jgi:hypothetical protein
MEEFFSPDEPFFQTLAEKAVKVRAEPNTAYSDSENIKSLTKLSLYQPVMFCGIGRTTYLHLWHTNSFRR